MTITLPTDKILNRLDHGARWIKGTWGDINDPAEPICLHGAIRACTPQPGDAYLIERVAEDQGWGTSFNDRSDTAWEDIKQALAAHREVTDEDLAATFGPTWEIVVDTVRLIASATPEQIEALAAAGAAVRAAARAAAGAAAWDAAGDAARAAARDAAGAAAWAAAWDAAGDAAWAAARDAARDAAWAAAWDAAGAAATADLAGQHNYTVEQLRLLAGPFASVFPESLLAKAVEG